MTQTDWCEVGQKTPWPFVAVTVQLAEGKQTLAFWTGHLWWGENRELHVIAWRPIEVLAFVAA